MGSITVSPTNQAVSVQYYQFNTKNMASKTVDAVEVEVIDLVSVDFGREDLNTLAETVNKLVERANNVD